jgi:hypothetical protein
VYRKAMNPVNRGASRVAGRSNATGATRPLLLTRECGAAMRTRQPSPSIHPT